MRNTSKIFQRFFAKFLKCIRYTQSVSIVFNLLHAKLFDCLQLSLVAVLLLNIGYLLASAVSLVDLGTLVQMRELETRNRFVAGWNQLLFVACVRKLQLRLCVLC